MNEYMPGCMCGSCQVGRREAHRRTVEVPAVKLREIGDEVGLLETEHAFALGSIVGLRELLAKRDARIIDLENELAILRARVTP